MKANKSVLKKWVAALLKIGRGKIQGVRQGKHGLRFVYRNTGAVDYCCLGVLCELHRVANLGLDSPDWVPVTGYIVGKDCYEYLGKNSFLPPAVAQWAFGDPVEIDPMIYGERLGRRNDKGQSFLKIASLLESRFRLRKRKR